MTLINLFLFLCFILYGLFSTWFILNRETMLNISKAGYRLSDKEIKLLNGEADFFDKISLVPKYILGAYIKPSMILFYIVFAILLYLRHINVV